MKCAPTRRGPVVEPRLGIVWARCCVVHRGERRLTLIVNDHRFPGEIKHVVMGLSGELTKKPRGHTQQFMAKQEVDLRQGASLCGVA